MTSIREFFESLLYLVNEMSPYVLLGFLIAGILHSFVKPSLMSRHLSSTDWKAVVKAAILGIPLPLCSCGVLPTAVALRRSGASRAASTSFLIATPQTGVDSIAATYAMLGGTFAVVRPIAALTTALAGGCLVGRSEKKHDLAEEDSKACAAEGLPSVEESEHRSIWDKTKGALRYGMYDMVQSIGGWLIGGLLIAALITVIVPDDFFVRFKDYTFLTMLAVVVIAVPMYVCATGSIPIALSLMLKGLSPGTALVMLMAGPAANFASITVISRSMGKRSAAIYIGSIIAGAIAFGLIIDLLLPTSWFAVSVGHMGHVAHGGHGIAEWFSWACTIVLALLLFISMVLPRLRKKKVKTENTGMEYKILGMNCNHCRQSVENGLRSLSGVTGVEVNLTTGIARVEGDVDASEVKACVRSLGFDVE